MSGTSVCGWLVFAVITDGVRDTLVMEQHYHNQEQSKQIEEFNKQIIKQNDQITQQHLQLEQLNIIINILCNNSGKVSREIE